MLICLTLLRFPCSCSFGCIFNLAAYAACIACDAYVAFGAFAAYAACSALLPMLFMLLLLLVQPLLPCSFAYFCLLFIAFAVFAACSALLPMLPVLLPLSQPAARFEPKSPPRCSLTLAAPFPSQPASRQIRA